MIFVETSSGSENFSFFAIDLMTLAIYGNTRTVSLEIQAQDKEW